MAHKLTLSDISDVRQYERDRDRLRAEAIDVKRRRRISIGTILLLTFENHITMRHQIHEMARVEKLTTDEEIQAELDIYNPMIPDPGQLCATMFLELTSDEQVRTWLSKLAGIETSLQIVLDNGDVVRSVIDEQHAAGLTRENVTAAVHYVRWELTPEQVDVFGSGPVRIQVDHPNYLEVVELLDSTRDELLSDLRG